ncbi:hypothetical protein N9A28_07760 [Sulfurimonas sp.]|nr:hypothetical protein [Sulfurimonas sp.]
MKFYILLFPFMILLFITTGCSNRPIKANNSGFFNDYKNLDLSKKIEVYKYKDILVSPVIVVSNVEKKNQTDSQKKLYKEISDYLTLALKKVVDSNKMYNLVEEESDHSLKLESAISAVEVHFEDEKWNNNTPVSLGMDVVSYNAYRDESVRLLGESRLVDSWSSEVFTRTRSIQKDFVISLVNEKIEFKNLKPSLDSWITTFEKNLSN